MMRIFAIDSVALAVIVSLGALVALGVFDRKSHNDNLRSEPTEMQQRRSEWAGSCPNDSVNPAALAKTAPTFDPSGKVLFSQQAMDSVVGGDASSNLPTGPSAWQVSQVHLYLEKGGVKPDIPCADLLRALGTM